MKISDISKLDHEAVTRSGVQILIVVEAIEPICKYQIPAEAKILDITIPSIVLVMSTRSFGTAAWNL